MPSRRVLGGFKSGMMIAFILSIAMDTIPLKPLPVLLPRPVKSEKTKDQKKMVNFANKPKEVFRL